MPLDYAKELTSQFYKWEQRGRGWHQYTEPVDLEPVFYPFFKHKVPKRFIPDDSKSHTLLSWLLSPFREQKQAPVIEKEDDDVEEYGMLYGEDDPLIFYALSYPKGEKVSLEATEQLLLLLSNCSFPLSFEIIGTESLIRLQLTCRMTDGIYVQGQLKTFFPDCTITESEDAILGCTSPKSIGTIKEYGLKEEFMRPLVMPKNFHPDPLLGIFGALEHLEEHTSVVIQILFKGAGNPWAESIIRSVSDSEGKPFFENAPEMLPLAKEKVSCPLFGVGLRIMGIARTKQEALSVTDMVGSAVGRIFSSSYNSLIPLSSYLSWEDQRDEFLQRQTHRVGMLLNTKELATIVHLPSESVTTGKLQRNTRKTKKAPVVASGHELILGTNEHQGKTTQVSLDSSQRLKHMHVIGATGTGKSTFLTNLIIQDIKNGEGVCVIDPHGDLIESILDHIPADRGKDCIVIDPSDVEFPIGFNILSAHTEVEKDILSSDLVATFKRLSTSWGDQMNSVLANAILAFLENEKPGTLVDLRRFLIEKGFRESILKTVKDPSVIYYWQKEFPLLKSGSIGSILTRLDTFLRPKLIRNMVAQKKSLDFEEILDSKRILLVKLSQGLIGNENSYLLGSFFITKMYQAAMARQMKAKADRSDYFLYIDEFQNFITPSIAQLLAGARKYHFGLILAHQEMQQLVKYDSELASSLVANAGTRVCFRLGDLDAKRFVSGFSFFEQSDLENLNTGEAICRIERPEYDFSLNTENLPSPDHGYDAIRTAVITYSRSKYGTPKSEVESELADILPETSPTEPISEYSVAKDAPASIQDTEVIPTTPDPPVARPKPKLKEKKKPAEDKDYTQHRYLQMLIKKMAESRGYVAKLEEPTPDGAGRVDVSLERNGKRIACEICVTTEKEWEVHNIQKCLAAGHNQVITCSTEKRVLSAISRKAKETLSEIELEKVRFLQPDELFVALDEEIAKEISTETRVKGYRVKVEYGAVSNAEADSKKSAIGRTVLNAKRRE